MSNMCQALRLAPVAPIGNTRLTPPEGAMIAGVQVPGNVQTHLMVIADI
jgi:hypothetical protein